MAIYGNRSYKPRYWVAEMRTADDCSYCETLIADAGRVTAFCRMTDKLRDKTDRIRTFREIDPRNTHDMEYYGFIPVAPRPSVNPIDYDLATD
jgi:hypothetical protein